MPSAAEAETAHESQTHTRARPSLASRYSPNDERPLGAYMTLAGAFTGLLGGSLLALRARGRELPERPHLADVIMLGIATHKLSRIITKDKVTSFLRAPFTSFQESTGHGEVAEEPRGHGLQLAMGELLVCPNCVGQWIAAGLGVGLVAAPRLTRLTSAMFVTHTISDFLQPAYRAAEEHAWTQTPPRRPFPGQLA